MTAAPCGKVYLIGAGPGDIELLTLKAVRVLSAVDVIMVDDLVNPEVLVYASPEAEILKVGKRGGRVSTAQALINEQMVLFARSGKTVARVKGGDPLIFGRGGEELDYLQAAGVDAEVVSGITAGIAVPATLGVSLTHRNYSHSVTFVTGASKDDGQPDWQTLAKSGSTLVIYMGTVNLPFIARQLMEGGLPPSTPAAAVYNGTLAAQQEIITTLACLSEAVRKSGFASPTLVVVGKVVSMARTADAPGGATRQPVLPLA